MTKSELAALTEKVDSNHIELRGTFEGLEKRLDTEAIERTKEHLPERVRAIEQHLGMETFAA